MKVLLTLAAVLVVPAIVSNTFIGDLLLPGDSRACAEHNKSACTRAFRPVQRSRLDNAPASPVAYTSVCVSVAHAHTGQPGKNARVQSVLTHTKYSIYTYIFILTY